MIGDDYFLFTIIIIYCVTSIFMFTKKLIYYIRCTCDSDFKKKQPVLWKESTIQDMILTITFTWLPVIIIKFIIDNLK